MNIKTKLRAIPTIPNKNICVPIGSMLAVQYFYEKLNFSDTFNKHKSKGLDLNSLLIGLVSYKLTENFSIKEAGKFYIPTPPLIFSLNFVDLVILALVDGDYFYKYLKTHVFCYRFNPKIHSISYRILIFSFYLSLQFV